MEELVGKTLGRYKILVLLGEGGMGAVYKAHDMTLQRDVAFKVMHPHFARQGDFKERFLQEARASARLDHPSVVQVYDFGQSNGILYIVMEFIPGDNLGKMLQELRAQGKWIDLAESVSMVKLVAEALHYAHSHGILHRDLKPGNIMIEPVASPGLPYRPVLTDLGLAKLSGAAALTQEGSSMGTPAYMSPEQALGESLDGRSDVYSLGVLLFELVTGRLPFPARTISDAIRYHTKEAPPKPRSILPAVPETLEKVILRALEKNPANRYIDAAAFAAALESALPAGFRTDVAQTNLGNTISLVTQYQNSLEAGRGPSVMQEFKAPADLSQDKIQVLLADKTSLTVAMKAGGIVIGRDDDNDIVVPNTKISRHHARIDFDGTRYSVVDLNSTNGTYLGSSRLLPGVPEEWQPGAAVRVGDAYLRLVLAEKKSASSVVLSNGTSVGTAQLYNSPGEGRVGIVLEAQQITVVPGQAANLTTTIVNQGQTVDHFKVWVEGIPAQWLKAVPPPIQLMPGMQNNIVIIIQPPRDPKSRAGRYSITVSAASQTAKDQVAQARGSVTVMPYFEFSTDMHPQRVRAGAAGKVTVHNKGNYQETFALNWKDRADEVTFEPAQTRLPVPAGQSAVAEFRARPRQRAMLGGEKIHPFTVQVQASQEAPQALTGELVSRALLPAWVIPVVTTLCLLVSLGSFLVYNALANQAKEAARQTEIAQLTAVMLPVHLAATQDEAVKQVAQTQTAIAAAALQATIAAATQNAPTPTHTPTVTETPVASYTPTPTPPTDGVSMNCDGTYQRFRINDAGSLGKTINIDSWTPSGWFPVFTLSSGNPMERQFGDDTGLYKFGECQQLLVIPTLISRVTELAIYRWNGSGLTQVFYKDGPYVSWTHEYSGIVFSQAVYNFDEPACCPCYRESTGFQWNGNEFLVGAAVLNPTFTGTPPAECVAPTPTTGLLIATFMLRSTLIFVLPTATP